MFKLVSENLTKLGGRMGTEYTYPNWDKYFTTKEKAKQYAEKDYGKTIEWFIIDEDSIRSPDLSRVMYHIDKVVCEE